MASVGESVGCNCLESCEMASNDFDLSYVLLSSLSVDSFLKSETKELREKYRRALEIKHVSQ